MEPDFAPADDALGGTLTLLDDLYHLAVLWLGDCGLSPISVQITPADRPQWSPHAIHLHVRDVESADELGDYLGIGDRHAPRSTGNYYREGRVDDRAGRPLEVVIFCGAGRRREVPAL